MNSAFIGCNQSIEVHDYDSEHNITKSININPNKAKDILFCSNLFEKIQYVPIATNDTFLIGKVDKLIASKNYYFILDRWISKSVFCTDKQGLPIFKISDMGTGPHQYTDINDIDYDEKNQELLIYCVSDNKILFYDTRGEFIRYKNISKKGLQFALTNKGYFALYSSFIPFNTNKEDKKKEPNLLLCDTSCILAENAYFDKRIKSSIIWTSFPKFSRLGDTLSIKPDHSNIVYHIFNDTIMPVLKFSFGEHNITHEYWEKSLSPNMTSKKMNEYISNKGICECYNFFEVHNYIYFQYRYHNQIVHTFYSKQTGTIKHAKVLYNNTDYIASFNPITTFEDRFYSIIDAEKISRNSNLEKRVNSMGNFIKKVSPTDNPIIISYNLKNF